MATPSMVVRVSANVEDLKRGMQDSERLIQGATGKVLQFTSATERSIPVGKQVSATYREFDGILQSLGINIGPYARGLEDIANLASKGASGLGLLGGAAAVVATAMAAWKFGEHAGEVSGLTDEIARGWSVLLGYGDVAQETMLAQMVGIELAGKAAENWKRQAESTAAATQAAAAHTAEMQREGMVTAGNAGHMAALANQLEAAKQKRVASANAARLAAHEEFFHGEKTKETTVAITEQNKAIDDKIARLEKLRAAAVAQQKQAADFAKYGFAGPPDDPAKTVHLLDGSWVTPEEAAKRKSAGGTFDLPSLTGFALDKVLGGDARQMTDAAKAQALKKALAMLEDKEGRYTIKNNDQFFQMQRETTLLAQLRAMQGSGQVPGFAGGVENFRGGLAYVHQGEMLANLPPGTDVIPKHQAGGNVTNHITVVVKGNVLSTAMELQQLVGEALLGIYRSGGLPLPRTV